jgi:hypothetical protein
MHEITISLRERNTLREFARNFGGALGDLQMFVERGRTAEDGERRYVGLLFPFLDAIGWRLEGDQESYRLRGDSDTLGFLQLCRDQASEFDEDDQADETVAVCDSILGRFGGGDVVELEAA